jgi:hypothetical protein
MHRSALLILLLAGCAHGQTVVPAVAPAAPPKLVPPAAPARAKIGATAQRNENVAVWAIDNNAVKEANIRVGTRATISQFTSIASTHYAVEHGQAPSDSLILPVLAPQPDWHSDLFFNHQNSVFNARTFFQVASVLPSRRNHYGVRATGSAGPLGSLTISGFGRKIRGMVNGNVLVPLPEERTPLTTDPAARDLIVSFFNAYPNQLPNRPDFDPRALNTNSPQRIDEVDGTIRLDRPLTASSSLSVSWTINRARTDAFQLVAGQNPDMDIHSHRGKASWRTSLNERTELVLGVGFQRTRSLLVAEPDAVGPRVRFGYQIEELGPDSQFPINRAQNSFRYGAQMVHTTGAHSFSFGGDATRYQLNGIETNNQRGMIQFTNNFGHTAIENLRWGTPSLYEVTLGELDRGYRSWSGGIYFADRWKLHSRLQFYYGVRYTAEGAPSEIRNRDVIPYGCDCNNVSPRVGLAAQLGRGWLLRTAGTVSYGALQPVTYQQVRNNLPLVHYIQVQNPDLVNPLAGLDLNSPAARVSPTVLSPDLTSAYAYQYNLSLEKRFLERYILRFGYLGSRSYKMANVFILNRAEVVPGIPLTPATVDLRRPDQRYYEIKNIVNAGTAFYDAAIVTLELPLRNGLAASATYTFSKAIDLGTDFTATAANRDLLSFRSQSQYNSFGDRKGLSNFDSPHGLAFDWSWQIPAGRSAWARGWQISGAALLKAGTPLTLFVGSDAPGFGNVDGGPSDRPSLVDASILGQTIGHPNEAPLILTRERFDYIHPGEDRGSLGRGTFRKARIANLNGAISKQWTFRGACEWSTMVRAEAYNLTNTPQFDEPQRNLTSPSFGRITNTLNDGRVLQIALRLML